MRPPRIPKCFKKKKGEDRRGKHTKAERLARIRAAKASIVNPTCRGCNNVLDTMCKTEEGDAVVCALCGLVDNNTCFDFEPPVFEYVPRSPFYKHKNYFAERLLQARNTEPRLSDKELDILSVVYDTYRDNSPLAWSEGNFTKRHCGTICRLIKKIYPESPFNRRVERWYQFRVYMCGSSFGELPYQVANQLRFLFDAYAEFFLIYLQEKKIPRRNITQLDLVILVLLYNLNPDHVSNHGWYFLNHNIVNMTPSVERDRERIREICEMINERILTHRSQNIKVNCYRWFREGKKMKKLKIPTVKRLLNMCLMQPMGLLQYVNYKKNNEVALLYYLDKQQCKAPTFEVVYEDKEKDNSLIE